MFVGREKEKALLEDVYGEEESQFVAVYGRRRVGKTLLIREAFNYTFTFQHAGLAKGDLNDQLYAFADSLRDAGLESFDMPSSWLEAFSRLKDLVRKSNDARKVIFIDELSWMDTPRSNMLVALESFWNGWASARRDVVLVVCASATSWMLNNVIHNKGGLYNRLTCQIHLRPFTLAECEKLTQARGVEFNRHQLLEGYMILGGVPYYWNYLRRGMSLSQSIDAMFFEHDAPLAKEYDFLFSSLFRNPAPYLSVVEGLVKHGGGMSRDEIARHAKLANSGTLTKRLEELESCGFIQKFPAYGKKSNGALYRLVDNFTLFYRKFVQPKTGDEHLWTSLTNSPRRNSWCGLAFERVCMEHLPQIKGALGIAGVQTNVSSWRCAADAERGINGSQIDLLIDRRDQIINVCEMKYSTDYYAPTKAVAESIRHKVHDFQMLTATRSALHVTLVTTYGLRRNIHAGIFQSVVTADDLFT